MNSLPDQVRTVTKWIFGLVRKQGPVKLLSDTRATMNREYCVINIISCLTKLKSVELEQPNFQHCGEQVLEAWYLAGKSDIKFTEEEQQKIGSLLTDTVGKIDSCIFSSGYSFDADRAPSALIHRSGLQFMLDTLRSYPASEKVVSFLQESESLETFDESLRGWKEDSTYSWDCVDHSRDVLQRPEGVPQSHSWWY